MNNKLKKVVSVIMLFMGIMILSNIVLTAIQKNTISTDNSILELDEDSETEDLLEKELKSKVKAQRVSFPTDDNICKSFEFQNTFCVLKHKLFPSIQTDFIHKGFDKFVYSPPELV